MLKLTGILLGGLLGMALHSPVLAANSEPAVAFAGANPLSIRKLSQIVNSSRRLSLNCFHKTRKGVLETGTQGGELKRVFDPVLKEQYILSITKGCDLSLGGCADMTLLTFSNGEIGWSYSIEWGNFTYKQEGILRQLSNGHLIYYRLFDGAPGAYTYCWEDSPK